MKLVVILCSISLVVLVKCEAASSNDDGDWEHSEENYEEDYEEDYEEYIGTVKEDPLYDEAHFLADEKDSPADEENVDTEDEDYIFEETEFGTADGEYFGTDDGSEFCADQGFVEDEDESSLKCLVCKAVIEVMRYEVEKVDPRKRIEVSATKSIQYSKSESFLAELMEDLCEYEDTFAAIRQVLVQKTIIRKMLKNNGAVEEAGDFSSGSILNENVNHLCLEVLGENEDIILKEFTKEVTLDNIEDTVCTQTAQYCTGEDTEDHTSRDEL